eukprot:g13552.t1
MLAVLVKKYAKAMAICSAYEGTLSSYSYALLVLHFLHRREAGELGSCYLVGAGKEGHLDGQDESGVDRKEQEGQKSVVESALESIATMSYDTLAAARQGSPASSTGGRGGGAQKVEPSPNTDPLQTSKRPNAKANGSARIEEQLAAANGDGAGGAPAEHQMVMDMKINCSSRQRAAVASSLTSLNYKASSTASAEDSSAGSSPPARAAPPPPPQKIIQAASPVKKRPVHLLPPESVVPIDRLFYEFLHWSGHNYKNKVLTTTGIRDRRPEDGTRFHFLIEDPYEPAILENPRGGKRLLGMTDRYDDMMLRHPGYPRFLEALMRAQAHLDYGQSPLMMF